jgi:queuine tRNA-ribosyltransferase
MDFNPIDPEGGALVDNQYSRAYLRHLIIANERLGAQIATIHNLAFYLRLMKEAREQILNNSFDTWKRKMIPVLKDRL